MVEIEIADLKEEIAALRREVEDLRTEADLDACHIAGLTAQIKALIAESEACPDKAPTRWSSRKAKPAPTKRPTRWSNGPTMSIAAPGSR